MFNPSVVNSTLNMHNRRNTGVLAPQAGEDEYVRYDFDIETDVDSADLQQVDKEQISKPKKEVLVDAKTRNKDFSPLIKDESAGLRESPGSEDGDQ